MMSIRFRNWRAGAGAALALLLVFCGVYAAVIRPWHMRWGATPAEVAETLPGDRYMPQPVEVSTRAITIHAPAEAVWPWLVQIGQGRGGFYSHDWLENLFFADMQNARAILPAYQDLQAGDHISLMRHGPFAVVAEIDPGHAIMLDGGWSWTLRPIDDHTSRLIVRYASFRLAGPLDRLYYATIFEPAHFIMEAGMMQGLKERAEGRRL